MQMSLDGFVSAGPNDEQKWVTWALSDIHDDVLRISDHIDTILIGRKLALDYIPFWEETLKQLDHEMIAFAQRIVAAKKVVFTKTMDHSIWNNTAIATGDLKKEVMALKNQPGKDMIVYGGVTLVASLLKEALIDEINLFINPVVIGRGESVFSTIEGFQQLNLVSSKVYPSGIILNTYTPAERIGR
ncbi:dihydrofolate reductase family protein [Spirosoma sp. BT702]|uniref:Dihydrofolate reductase family protein n=2 Tax=Spirosoma profusum TaxID=2771354 RepID=A0A927AVZ7_9BACT|nr:dihydrofolate reductase family protein [Spirosoma profusum]